MVDGRRPLYGCDNRSNPASRYWAAVSSAKKNIERLGCWSLRGVKWLLDRWKGWGLGCSEIAYLRLKEPKPRLDPQRNNESVSWWA